MKPLIPKAYLPDNYLPFTVPGVGLIFGIVGLMVIGALTANLFGRSLVSYGEILLARMPIVRSVYRTLKQIFETVLSKNGGSFKRVGLIEFPRRGLHSIVFLAGDPPQEIEEKIGGGDPLITVFMPNGPNPTTGFILFVPASEVIPLDLSGGGRSQARGLGGPRGAGGRRPHAQARQAQGDQAASRGRARRLTGGPRPWPIPLASA